MGLGPDARPVLSDARGKWRVSDQLLKQLPARCVTARRWLSGCTARACSEDKARGKAPCTDLWQSTGIFSGSILTVLGREGPGRDDVRDRRLVVMPVVFF